VDAVREIEDSYDENFIPQTPADLFIQDYQSYQDAYDTSLVEGPISPRTQFISEVMLHFLAERAYYLDDSDTINAIMENADSLLDVNIPEFSTADHS
jgi:hypothetical protein